MPSLSAQFLLPRVLLAHSAAAPGHSPPPPPPTASPLEVCLPAQNRWRDIPPLEPGPHVLLLLLPNAKNDKNLLCLLGGGKDQIELWIAVNLLVGQDSQAAVVSQTLGSIARMDE